MCFKFQDSVGFELFLFSYGLSASDTAIASCPETHSGNLNLHIVFPSLKAIL